jgi:hypothetical protein
MESIEKQHVLVNDFKKALGCLLILLYNIRLLAGLEPTKPMMFS